MTHDRPSLQPTVEEGGHLLEMTGISKSFPGVRALNDLNLSLKGGEVLALLGENGAGKSTLIKVLGGVYRAQTGHINIHGQRLAINSPSDAQHAGIAIIYQEFNLIPALSVRENIFLGRENHRAGFVKHADEHRRALALFQRIGISIDPEKRCNELSVAQQQVVEIAKALSVDARIIVMDEPSATLTSQEVKRLFAVIRDLKRHGIGVIYISHRLEEIFEIADRVMVMRDGQHVASRAVGDIDHNQLIEMMVGRQIENEFPKTAAPMGDVRLKVMNLHRGQDVRNVSFNIRRGEVLGLAGLVGAGRTEICRLIFGADRPDAGTIQLDGKKLHIRSPRDAIEKGICLLTEDRKAHGLILNHSVRENFALPNLARFAPLGLVNHRRERNALARYVDHLRIKIPHYNEIVKNLSGGNQQKVVLAKWLERNCDVIIFDEPTRGIDVGAKYELYLLINHLAQQGKAILMVSSELPEILGMSDRILVMHQGRITGEITDVRNATQEQIMQLAVA